MYPIIFTVSVIIHFWVTPKFIFLFFKKKIAQYRFERYCAAYSPLRMQGQGRRRFLKCFIPAISLHPTCLKIHITIPCKHFGRNMRQTKTHADIDPCPALEQVWWPSFSTFYKYKGRLHDRRGGKILEKERRAVTDGEEKKQKGREIGRERSTVFFREKGETEREKQ